MCPRGAVPTRLPAGPSCRVRSYRDPGPPHGQASAGGSGRCGGTGFVGCFTHARPCTPGLSRSAGVRAHQGEAAMSSTKLLCSLLFASMTVAWGAGCRQEVHEEIPPSALLGSEGEKRLTFTTNGPGMIYVHDQTDNS